LKKENKDLFQKNLELRLSIDEVIVSIETLEQEIAGSENHVQQL
jgi:hypothetical protein